MLTNAPWFDPGRNDRPSYWGHFVILTRRGTPKSKWGRRGKTDRAVFAGRLRGRGPQFAACARQRVFHRLGRAAQWRGAVSAALRPSRLASSAARSSGESRVRMRCTTRSKVSLAMASSSGPGAASSSGSGTLSLSGACFFAGGGAAGVLLGVPDARRGKRHERRAAVRIIAAQRFKQTDESLLHGVLEIQAGGQGSGARFCGSAASGGR